MHINFHEVDGRAFFHIVEPFGLNRLMSFVKFVDIGFDVGLHPVFAVPLIDSNM